MTEIKYGGTIEHIKDLLKKYTLEDFSFIALKPQWLHKEAENIYKGCVSIVGNFCEYPNAFYIITDDKKLVNELKSYFSKEMIKESSKIGLFLSVKK